MSLKQLRRDHPRRQVEVDGTPVEVVRTYGSGPTLLMLPGAQGTAESFVHQILAFGAQRDVLSVHYPGWPDMASLADLIVAVTRALGIRRFDLVGSSLGGYLAQWIAMRHRDCVHRLVVGNSFDDPRPAQTPERLSRLVDRCAEAVKLELVERLLAESPSETRSTMLDLIGVQLSAEMLRDRMLAVQRAAPLDEGAQVASAMMIIESADDPVISQGRRASLRGRYPAAQVVTLTTGGHYPYLSTPHAYNAALAQFLLLG